MLFDELTTGLDPHIAAQLQADLFSMAQGFILITHQYDAATFAKADEIIVLANGKVIAQGRLHDDTVMQALRTLNLR